MTVYLLHATKRLGGAGSTGAQHYVGHCEEGRLEERLALHRAGRSKVKIIAAFVDVGAELLLAHVWPEGGQGLERWIKDTGHVSRYCPICRAEEQARVAAAYQRKRQRLGMPSKQPLAKRMRAIGGALPLPSLTAATIGAGASPAVPLLVSSIPSGSIGRRRRTGGTSLPATAPPARSTNG